MPPTVDWPERRPRYTLGNHDDVALLRAHLLGRDAEPGPLDEVVRIGALRVVGLDSSVPGEDHGELDDAQLEALADELAEPAPDGTVLAVHHPPIWSTTPMSELVALRDPQRLAEVIRGGGGADRGARNRALDRTRIPAGGA